MKQVIVSTRVMNMDTGSVVTALVKEYTAERPRNMAIYCRSARITMRGRSYVFERLDDNGNYIPKAAFTDKGAALFLLHEMVRSYSVGDGSTIELKNKESSYFDVLKLLSPFACDQERNRTIIVEFLNVLASESSITL
jgi:hypothetical protein